MTQSYLGIDMSKGKFHVALQLQSKPENKPKQKVFKNDMSGFEQLQQWLKQQGAGLVHACLEATSTYGEAVADIARQ